ncbi:ADP-ribosylation factor GTPase-activating protein AGD3-like isoform X2 [Asparagus officinalis]|uniref:ADP-ribosylation factor GTPase-activating protein AGD3-like isoform X2 n=1 Tax=Asparagus officinalis TaxID=4686 RepID=UPI00098E242B|nr:ADP-ribosylation factor GTPase-activating protein AGD3-like isoform X2 [Asparagus officinalis]
MLFAKLDDSPMFRKQIQSLEDGADLLRERCLKFYKGCRKYTERLAGGYDGDAGLATALEMFGGPVMTKFTIALREIGTYKEVLRSQVEHTLNDRLLDFVDIDLHNVKDARKRFDKASLVYDQAREKYLSLKKGTRADITTILEDELHRARSSFEQARFNLVTALSHIEAKKRYAFLEAVSGMMDAHLCFFKQGYELLHQMEPYIKQVLAYAQQSRQRSNYEQEALTERMQEFKRQIDRESLSSSYGLFDSPNGDGIQTLGRSSYKMIEAVMQTAVKGKVQTIRQGYLSKRSSNLRGDWKRRFFVLDSRGMLYYYRKQLTRPSGVVNHHLHHKAQISSENGSGLLSRWFSSHYHGGVDEKSGARHTVNLLTSTIKVDADQSDLRFCFRIISPTKNYTLQAESAMDQMDWIEKITGVIASLLSAQFPEQCPLASASASNESSFGSSSDLDHSVEVSSLEKNCVSSHSGRTARSSQQHRFNVEHEKPIDVLQKVCGNDVCADCGAAGPDWASLNLGLLVCIECSGVHRNLGVHISKVRSLTLDVKVWEPSVINLFQSLGNTFANSIWEELLPSTSNEKLTDSSNLHQKQQQISTTKPKHTDPISIKENFIKAKYAEKVFLQKSKADPNCLLAMWDNVRTNNKRAVYQHIITLNADVNAIYGQTSSNSSLTLAKAMLLQEQPTSTLGRSTSCTVGDSKHKASSISSCNPARNADERNNMDESFEGCSLLHLACQTADIAMVELLLQYGANVNAADLNGRTPLHHCIIKGRNIFAKLLISRGADPHVVDKDGKTPLQYALESGTIDNEEILVLLEDTKI